MKHLEGKVTLVTGATRGIGKGIAIGLGEAGATVYITGRSLHNSDSSDDISGSLSETQAAVEEVGGVCIPVQVDHSDDEPVRERKEGFIPNIKVPWSLLILKALSSPRI